MSHEVVCHREPDLSESQNNHLLLLKPPHPSAMSADCIAPSFRFCQMLRFLLREYIPTDGERAGTNSDHSEHVIFQLMNIDGSICPSGLSMVKSFALVNVSLVPILSRAVSFLIRAPLRASKLPRAFEGAW